MLLDFVRERDVECPLCGYNLRDLTRPTCPECEHPLELRVGVQQLRLMPFVMAIVPGIFSGFCAIFIAGIFVVNIIMNNGQPVGIPWPMVLLDVFGWLSGFIAIGLILARHRFLARPAETQRGIAITVWTIHIMAFLVLLIAIVG